MVHTVSLFFIIYANSKILAATLLNIIFVIHQNHVNASDTVRSTSMRLED